MPATYASAPTTASLTDLIRFLLSRTEDDEAELKRMTRSARTPRLHAGAQPEDAETRSVARLRAEAASKRQIIGSVQHLLVLRDQPCEKPVRDAAAQILRALASPYADHPQYREEWRPLGRH